MEIFIVFGDYGSWDSHYRKVLKVFSTLEKAEKFIEDYKSNENIKKFKDLDYRNLWGGDTDDDGNFITPLTKEEDQFYHDNYMEINELSEFNDCFIDRHQVE